ncbi:MAG: SDR family NAD(P)-dependent oxidoreductase [Xanthobacteraceae bacterium]
MAILTDKVCIITGGAGSLGLASARLFVSEGAKVMLVDLEDDALKRAVAELKSPRVDMVAADVSDAASTRNYVERTVAKFGAVDVLFSNAGNNGPVAPVHEYPEDAFDRLIAVHVRGAFLACKYALPKMKDGGSIIITSSVVGTMGAPGSVAYVTAKHAQVGLMRTVAKEAARRGIRVNTLHPGPIDNSFQLTIEQGIGKMAGGIDGTKMLDGLIPLHRHGRPDEIARTALYLASDMSSFTTSSTVMADGGMRG